ncbi:MAG: DUF1330 domain-containing protein [Alphaproteobacteria bacterium]
MPAYFIANITVTNPEGIKEYQALAPATIEAYGGRYIVRGGAHETLEGDWKPDRMVVLEFPDVETARTWYNSPEYQEILPLRQDNSDGKIVLVEGL